MHQTIRRLAFAALCAFALGALPSFASTAHDPQPIGVSATVPIGAEVSMHYKNGREAKVGDPIVGTAYNTTEPKFPTGGVDAKKLTVTGTLVKAIPGTEACNAEVEFLVSKQLKPGDTPLATLLIQERPRMAVGDPTLSTFSEWNGAGAPNLTAVATWRCRDYTQVSHLLHAEDALSAQEVQVGEMVRRFLAWKLPADFAPDAGISFKPAYNEGTPYEARHEPVGTNLLNATQAEALVRHLLGSARSAQS